MKDFYITDKRNIKKSPLILITLSSKNDNYFCNFIHVFMLVYTFLCIPIHVFMILYISIPLYHCLELAKCM